MVLNVDNVSKKLMEEIRESISGEVLRKLDEILKDIRENPVDISNLVEKNEVEKLKKILDRLYENTEDISKDINKKINGQKEIIINAISNNASKNDFESLISIVNNLKYELEIIKDTINKMEHIIDNKISNIEKEQSNILLKLNSIEETLEYLSLPFFKRLFWRKK